MSVLVLAEHDEKKLGAATARAVNAAAQLGGDIVLLVTGGDCDAVAREASQLAGVVKVLVAQAPHLSGQLAEEVAPVVARAAGGFRHVLAAATTTGKDVLPRVAALLDVAQVSEVIRILSEDTFMRPVYAGNAYETVQSRDALIALTVRTTAFAAAGGGGSAPVERVEVPAALGISSLVSVQAAGGERPDLSTARVVVSGGRGLGSQENFRLLEKLADRLGGAVGASRAAVDAGYVPNDLQVGQTGKVVAPELYIAVGISGAIQHLAGMKDSRVIVAINKDENAPIFELADYGLVGDLFTVLADLERELG